MDREVLMSGWINVSSESPNFFMRHGGMGSSSRFIRSYKVYLSYLFLLCYSQFTVVYVGIFYIFSVRIYVEVSSDIINFLLEKMQKFIGCLSIRVAVLF